MTYVTRIAPSPTGMMHIGTARTALFNWLAAKATGGQFILRMDDTDHDRNQEEAVQPILDGLTWLGLDYDAYHRQSDRSALYVAMAALLLDMNLAYKADNGAVLLHGGVCIPAGWNDEVGGAQGVSDTMRDQISNLVLLRGGDKLGQATYHFSSTVDDFDMGVNYVIRGVDHITNTAKHVAIWNALNIAHAPVVTPLPKFSHVGLIYGPDKKKLSKRDGAASLLDYRDKGYDPDAIFNFLLRLGWGPKNDDKSTNIISRDRAIELFLDGGKMRAANAGFDPVKLDWYDRRYKAMKNG